eukprot:RCo041573
MGRSWQTPALFRSRFLPLISTSLCFHMSSSMLDPVLWDFMVLVQHGSQSLYCNLHAVSACSTLCVALMNGPLLRIVSHRWVLAGMCLLQGLCPLVLVVGYTQLEFTSQTLFYAVYVLFGVAWAGTSVCPAYIATHTDSARDRCAEMSFWYMGWTIGDTAGPILAALVIQAYLLLLTLGRPTTSLVAGASSTALLSPLPPPRCCLTAR